MPVAGSSVIAWVVLVVAGVASANRCSVAACAVGAQTRIVGTPPLQVTPSFWLVAATA
jgi:hypothetical protein